ncbi:uncharacterized protein LOC119561808 [Drosophila subpulchrella]|uniref:uncharacterized protein LOC119561808 n=1 Tax=Drosophila subpulchrella TaxID=1486046 RepID=UPI0018A1B06C|nr:uncharacterized protein LOC119561808 [Drosophila subpulchrella]
MSLQPKSSECAPMQVCNDLRSPAVTSTAISLTTSTVKTTVKPTVSTACLTTSSATLSTKASSANINTSTGALPEKQNQNNEFVKSALQTGMDRYIQVKSQVAKWNRARVNPFDPGGRQLLSCAVWLVQLDVFLPVEMRYRREPRPSSFPVFQQKPRVFVAWSLVPPFQSPETKPVPETPNPALKVVRVPNAKPRTERDGLKDAHKKQIPRVKPRRLLDSSSDFEVPGKD